MLFYTDTDSIVITKPLPDYLVGNKLGQFKLEYEINQAVFLAPKVYAFTTKDDQKVVKVKGISKQYLESTEVEDFRKLLYLNASIKYSQARWFKKLFAGDFLTSDVAYQLKVTSNKRRPLYSDEKLFYDTRPFYYQEIEVE